MKDEFCKSQNCGHYIPKEIAGIGGAPMASGRCRITLTGVKKTFLVEIYCDLTDGGMKFWLESQELRLLEKQIIEETINTEYQKIKDSGILIVQVS